MVLPELVDYWQLFASAGGRVVQIYVAELGRLSAGSAVEHHT